MPMLLAVEKAVEVGIPTTSLLVIAVIFVILAIIVIKIVKKMLINSILGVAALFLLNIVGLKIPLTAVSFLIVAILGLFGVAVLAILQIFGIKVP